MKKRYYLLAVGVLLVSVLTGCGAKDKTEAKGTQATGEVLTVGFDQNFPPMGFKGDDGKYKSKLIDKKQSAQSFSQAFFSETSDDVLDDDALKIVKVKKFAIKPMDPEEAVLQMEMLGHAFFVFLNSETENVNVVYKRKNGTYGIIEPES